MNQQMIRSMLMSLMTDHLKAAGQPLIDPTERGTEISWDLRWQRFRMIVSDYDENAQVSTFTAQRQSTVYVAKRDIAILRLNSIYPFDRVCIMSYFGDVGSAIFDEEIIALGDPGLLDRVTSYLDKFVQATVPTI